MDIAFGCGDRLRFGSDCHIRSIGLAAALALLAMPVSVAHASIIAPAGPVTEGVAVRIALESSESVRRPILHYRAAGSVEYQTVSLARSGLTWAGQVPAETMLRPGIEYFVSFESATGAIMTDPPQYPRYNPYRLFVSRSALATLAPSEPVEAGDAVMLPLSPTIDTQGVRLLIDGRDVTQATRFNKTRAIYLPLERFSVGEHRAELLGADGRVQASGNFSVQAAATNTQALHTATSGYASLAYGAGPVQPSGFIGNEVFANAHGAGEAKRGDIALFAHDVDVNYAHRDSIGLTVATGFAVGGRIGKQSLSYGDSALHNDVPLLNPSAVRRGFHLNLQDNTHQADFFVVSANPAEGFTAAPISENGGNIFGANYHQQWASDPQTLISFSAVGGEIKQQGGTGLVSTLKPMEGRNLGARLQTQLWNTAFDAQLALSEVDAQLAGSPGTLRSSAYAASATRPIQNINLSGKLWGYGEGYATLADPALLADRAGWELGAAQPGTVAWGLSAGAMHDNVNTTASRPVVTSVHTAGQVGVNLPALPALSLALSRAKQSSAHEPNGLAPTNNVLDSVVLGSTYARPQWDVAINIGNMRLDDKSAANSDVRSQNFALSGHASRDKIKLGALAAYTESEEPTRSQNGWLFAGDGILPLWNDRTTLQGQAMLLQGSLKDQFVSVGGRVRLAWTLPRSAGWRNLFAGDAQLILTGSRLPSFDSATGPVGDGQIVVLAGFVVGTPVSLAWPETAP